MLNSYDNPESRYSGRDVDMLVDMKKLGFRKANMLPKLLQLIGSLGGKDCILLENKRVITMKV